jgi:hypothetical protein
MYSFLWILKCLPKNVLSKVILKFCKTIDYQSIANVYPFECIPLRNYLCCLVSNTLAEWKFIVLKITRSYLRSSINDNCLNNLLILNIECEIPKLIGYNEVIVDFTAQKSHHIIKMNTVFLFS